MKETHILSLNNISKSFGDNMILDHISLDIRKGEFLTLLGPSGCGKTTTLRIIAGLERLDSGAIILKGGDITNAEPENRSVNTVFQNYALFPHMNVYKNIAYGPKLKKISKKEIDETVKEMLALVKMEGYEGRMPHQLSGGQRQRIAIARAIVNKPDILLLDEPLGALDLKLRRHMQGELKRIQRQTGVTFIYVTHDQEEALDMSDRLAIMNRGRFEQIGSPEEIYNRPKTEFVAQFVGERNIIHCQNGGFMGFLLPESPPDGLIAIHSDKIKLSPSPFYGGCIEGLVKSRSYTGPQVKSTIAIREEFECKVTEYNGDNVFSPGDKVYLSWDGKDGVSIC